MERNYIAAYKGPVNAPCMPLADAMLAGIAHASTRAHTAPAAGSCLQLVYAFAMGLKHRSQAGG